MGTEISSENNSTGNDTAIQNKPHNMTRPRIFQVLACILPLALRFTTLESTKVATISIFMAAIVLFEILWDKKGSDPYGLFHLAMNVRPGDEGQAPKTEWLNMGYWKDTNIFPDACEALALKLMDMAHMKAGDVILDVGHGTGESLITLLTNPNIPRPSKIVGITSLSTHHQHSLERVQALQANDVGLASTQVNLYAGDAVFRPEATDHPLDPSSSSPSFDAILALDCAYHFVTRELFLKQCHSRLSLQGRIALADICFAPSSLKMTYAQAVISLLPLMPKANAVSIDHYTRQMQEAGFNDVLVEDISDDVFPGFISFLRGRGFGWLFFTYVLRAYMSAGARFVIASGTR